LSKPILETFENAHPERDYIISTSIPEFTSLCPKTGRPDFGTLTIVYVPNKKCIELKSLKFYIQSFRNQGIFYERVVNQILNDLVDACQPRSMTVHGAFTPRGGISTSVEVKYP